MLIHNVSKEYYDCFQGVIATVAQYWQKDYESVALGKIGFEYNNGENCEKMYERLNPEKWTAFPSFWEIIGIKKRDFTVDEISVQTIKTALNQGKPILMWSDLYNCSWTKLYQKRHYFHCYLITDLYKDYFDEFKVNDPFYKQEDIIQKYDDIIKHSYRGSFFETICECEKKDRKILYLIREDASKYINNNCSEKIKCFAEDIPYWNYEEELFNDSLDISSIPMIDKIRMFGEQRKAYAVMMKKIQENIDIGFEVSIQNLNLSYELWKNIKLQLFRSVISKRKIDVGYIREKLDEISKIEYLAMNDILEKNKKEFMER